jgi:hypothetical protein
MPCSSQRPGLAGQLRTWRACMSSGYGVLTRAGGSAEEGHEP